jgi:hypothetical protein
VRVCKRKRFHFLAKGGSRKKQKSKGKKIEQARIDVVGGKGHTNAYTQSGVRKRCARGRGGRYVVLGACAALVVFGVFMSSECLVQASVCVCVCL